MARMKPLVLVKGCKLAWRPLSRHIVIIASYVLSRLLNGISCKDWANALPFLCTLLLKLTSNPTNEKFHQPVRICDRFYINF